MIEVGTLVAFLAAVLAIQLSPGPDMMLVVARGVTQGRRIALCCVAGISSASLVQIPALALGVATVFQQSPLAYALLKNLGAAYLIYVGVRFLLSKASTASVDAPSIASARAAFFQGFWGNLANPKSLVFLLAFLPQFVDPARGSVALQLFLLGAIHKTVGLLVDGSVALLAASSGAWLKRHVDVIRWQQRLVGSILIGLGLRLALDDGRS